jgi:hypothetical protein
MRGLSQRQCNDIDALRSQSASVQSHSPLTACPEAGMKAPAQP